MENEHQGQGGSYLLDPKTGQAKLIEQTKPATTPASLPEELTNEPEDSQAPVKGKN
jgi:hypothetical protein